MAYPAKIDRKRILAAALRLLARRGLGGMSLRAVATSLKIAPNALYRYFADHAHLEAAVGAEVSRMLYSDLLKAKRPDDAARSIRDLAVAYLKFARRHALLYEALLIPRPASGAEAVAPEQLWLFVVEQVGRLTGKARAPDAALALWGFLHGTAALQSAGRLGAGKRASGIEFGLSAWLAAAGPPGVAR